MMLFLHFEVTLFMTLTTVLQFSHSFPTRRSSDLVLNDVTHQFSSLVPQRHHRFDLRRPACGDIDRKSTRLNSSHGYTSYAVFCLKKKIMLFLHLEVQPLMTLPSVLSLSCALISGH